MRSVQFAELTYSKVRELIARKCFTSKRKLITCLIAICITVSMLVYPFVVRTIPFAEPFSNFDVAKAYGTPWSMYHYNPTQFHRSTSRWRNEHPGEYHVMVILSQPSSTFVSSQSLVSALHDVLSSKQAQVVVFLHRYDDPLVLQIETDFETFVQTNQLILLTSSYESVRFENYTATFGVRDDFFMAYLLELSYQSQSDFTIALRCCELKLTNSTEGNDYVAEAVNHYLSIENELKQTSNMTDRVCWTRLSDKSDSSVIFLNTSEHASRLSVTLRSSLPYNFYKYSDVLNMYCENFIWSGRIIMGLPLFSSSLHPDDIWANATDYDPRQPITTIYSSALEKLLIDPRDFGVPDWIHPTPKIGPLSVNSPPPFRIAFAVSAMKRPNVKTKHLETFLKETFNLVETHFQRPDRANNTYGTTRLDAVIVVLVSGNSRGEIKSLRKILEVKYAKAIEAGIIKLVNSPLQSIERSLRVMRSTYREDTPERRYWRSKQNLDIGALLEATIGLSDFVMLLEDDVGFLPSFAEKLKDVMMHEVFRTLWARADFGFGYAGILLRGIDVPVYQHMHATFFDEHPCDFLNAYSVVRSGFQVDIGAYLSHFGTFSSLIGKIQGTF
jgi:N-Acetylglucosaminyltransferase-IV (GnT-IV) conserved region